jgi:thioredoxin reductase (NADPH)
LSIAFTAAVAIGVYHTLENDLCLRQDHIGSLNWGYRVALREKNVTYINAYGTFIDAHTIKTVDKKNREVQ